MIVQLSFCKFYEIDVNPDSQRLKTVEFSYKNDIFNSFMSWPSIYKMNDMLCPEGRHISLASFLWDIGKQYSPRCDAAESVVPF